MANQLPFKTYLVGGAVREKLLNLPIRDRDWVVVGATPQQMLDLGFQQVGKDFPVFLHPKTKEEYALARTERKTGPGYTGFSVYASPDVTLEQDLQRRDLTINAMAEDESGHIIDPFDGQHDLKNKLLRHISPAFAEDPVRILRVARFAARYAKLHFTVAEETNTLMQAMVSSGEVDALVAERVWSEFERALCGDSPKTFIKVLRECNALAVLFPELDHLFGIPNPEKHHPEIDTGIHTLMVLDQAVKLSSKGTVRFAALTHDLGKGITPKRNWPSHINHENLGVGLIKNFCQRYKVPHDYKDLAIITAKHHLQCHKSQEMKPTTLVSFLETLDAFRRPERFHDFITACEADARGRKGFENRDYPQTDFLKKALDVTSKVDVKPILEQGYTGKEIAKRLYQARVTAVKGL